MRPMQKRRATANYIWDSMSVMIKGANWRNPGFTQDQNHPVVCVSWNDAVAFAKWLSEKTGYKFRLPTEAEWEYACRSCGKEVKYGTSSGKLSHDLANYDGTGGKDVWEHTSPVGSFPPNQAGLYDMSGNVWEWCSDYYDGRYYEVSPKDNPKGPKKGQYRVIRGGSWDYSSRYVRCAHRYFSSPGNGDSDVGFRLVLEK